MSSRVAGESDGGNTPNNVKDLHPAWILAFLFLVSFVGLFSIIPLRKVLLIFTVNINLNNENCYNSKYESFEQMMILKYKLTYPSGTATAYLINSFHTPKGAKLAKKQVGVLFKSFGFSFVFAFFQWFYTAADACGFNSFPTFGLQAFKQK